MLLILVRVMDPSKHRSHSSYGDGVRIMINIIPPNITMSQSSQYIPKKSRVAIVDIKVNGYPSHGFCGSGGGASGSFSGPYSMVNLMSMPSVTIQNNPRYAQAATTNSCPAPLRVCFMLLSDLALEKSVNIQSASAVQSREMLIIISS
jgi:hypothetical protein